MDDKKKKIEEINKIYQNFISSEEEKQKQKFSELYKSIHEPLSSVEQQKQEQIELLKKSFNSVKSSMSDISSSEIPNSNSYIGRYDDMAQNLIDAKNLSHATKDLLSFTENINKDKFKYDMEQLNKIEPIYEFKHQELQDFPNYGKMITDSLKNQRDSVIKIVEHLEEHSAILKDQIENNNLASQNIIDENKKTANEQIKLLKQQIDKSDKSFAKQLEDSRKQMRWTIAIAVVSIVVAIGSTIWSLNKSEDIYYKEDNSSNLQHKEIKEILENNNNKNLVLEDKQLNVLNQILQSLNEKKILKDNNITK